MDENFENRVRDFQRRVAAERAAERAAVGYPTQRETVASRRTEFAPLSFSPIEKLSDQEATSLGGGVASEGGAFKEVFISGGDYFLLNGTVSAGEGSATVDQSDLNLGTVGSEPSDGTEVFLRMNCTGIEVDGVYSRIDLTTVSIVSSGSSPDLPVHGSLTGRYDHRLGEWFGGVFRPSSGTGGNLVLSYCPPNGFSVS